MDEVPSCVGVTSPDCPLSTGPLQLIVAEQYRGVVKYTKIINITYNIQECSVVRSKVTKIHVRQDIQFPIILYDKRSFIIHSRVVGTILKYSRAQPSIPSKY